MTLIGHTDQRGTAWHYRRAEQGDEPNHYAGAVPVEDVRRRLFHWQVLVVLLKLITRWLAHNYLVLYGRRP